MLYTMKNATEIFEVSRRTITNWCDLASEFLSEDAKPTIENGRRAFTSDDLKVFALIKTSKDYDSAYAALKNGQRGEVPAMVSDYSLSIENRQQISLLENRVMQLTAQVHELQGERDKRIEAEAQNRLLRELLREAQQELLKAQKGL